MSQWVTCPAIASTKLWLFLLVQHIRVNSQGWIFFRAEYFSGLNNFLKWIFFRSDYFSGGNIFRGEYFSGVNISQFKFRIRTDYFGLVLVKSWQLWKQTPIYPSKHKRSACLAQMKEWQEVEGLLAKSVVFRVWKREGWRYLLSRVLST